MLTKSEVEAFKKVIMESEYPCESILGLIETLEEAMEVIKYYAKDEVNGHKAGRFLAKYEGVEMEEEHICFTCANAFVTDDDELHCIIKDKIVKDDDNCEEYN